MAKKPGLSDQAKKRFGKGGVSMSAILSDPEKEPEEDISKEEEQAVAAKPQNRKSIKKESPDPPKVEEAAAEEGGAETAEPSKIEHTERHFFYFSEALTLEMLDFMRDVKPREKNKNRFMRVLLHMFFDNPKEKQEELYRAGLLKYKDLVG